LEDLTNTLSINNEYINWKSFLLIISRPYPEPTLNDLLQSAQLLRSCDQAQLGMITRDDFIDVS